MPSTLSLRGFSCIAFETVRVGLVDNRPFLSFQEKLLSTFLCTPQFSTWFMVWCPGLCACRYCLKLLNTKDLLRCKTLVIFYLPATPSSRSFPLTLASPHESLKVNVNHCHQPQLINKVTDWWIPHNTFKTSNKALSLMTREIRCNQIRQVTV